MDEILNIEYHTKRLFLKALNTSRTNLIVAQKLGISEKTFYRLKKNYNVKKDQMGNFYMQEKSARSLTPA